MTKTELNKLYKDYTSEFDDLSVHELKLLMAYRMELRGITRWDDFVEKNRKYHQEYLINLGVEVDKEDQKTEEEIEAKEAVKH